jgi:hypothetical protein
MNMPKKRPTIVDPVNDGKLFDSHGQVASDMKAKRKELVSELVDKLQATVEASISGSEFSGKVDLAGNYLFELRQYTNGLKEACTSIVENYPNAENDQGLNDLASLCDITAEGIERAEQYLNELKGFSEDLQKIKGQIYSQLQIMHTEV